MPVPAPGPGTCPRKARFPQIQIPPQRFGLLSVPLLWQIWNLVTSLTRVSSLRDYSKSGTYTSSPSGLPRRPRALAAQQGRQHAGHCSARLTGGTFATALAVTGAGGLEGSPAPFPEPQSCGAAGQAQVVFRFTYLQSPLVAKGAEAPAS